MAGLSSPGIGSGLDIRSLISQLVAAERTPVENRLNRREASYQAELTAYGSLKSVLSVFQDALSKLTDYSSFQSLRVTPSDRSVITASATDSAVPGQFAIEVTDLAKSQTLASKAFGDVTTAVGTGTLTFQFGSYDSGANTFSVSATQSTRTVDISTTDNSLVGIRDAVNNAAIGVSASIVNDGTGNRLVFNVEDSGAQNSLKISVSDLSDASNIDDAGLSQLAYDPTATGSGKNMTETVTAQDAAFTVNGLPVTSSSNEVTGVIEGLTLNLLAQTSGTAVTLSLSPNTTVVSDNVQSFVDGYNDLMKALNNLTSYNAETGQAAVLQGDALTRGLNNQVRNILSSAVAGLGGAYRSLADIGITTQEGGILSLDKTKLSGAMTADFTVIGKLFSVAGSVSDPLIKFLDSSAETKVGDYAVTVTQLATRAKLSGAAVAPFPLIIDANNDTLRIKVDGAQSSDITLTQKEYATADELAAELQSRINGDAVLSGGGNQVSVNFVTDHFEITSNRYGSGSTVEITAVGPNTSTTLGLSVSSGTTGLDVAGTINGFAAIGSGQVLTGSGAASGIQLEILGGATGNRGSVVFSRGIAEQLHSMLEGYLNSDSIIDARTKGLNNSIDDITVQRDKLVLRLAQIEQRYLVQFTALDALLGQMQSTSGYLAQQLASLPGTYTNK